MHEARSAKSRRSSEALLCRWEQARGNKGTEQAGTTFAGRPGFVSPNNPFGLAAEFKRSRRMNRFDALAGESLPPDWQGPDVVGGTSGVCSGPLRAIEEFFLTYDLMNAHAVIHDQRVADVSAGPRYRALRFAPHHGQSMLEFR
jgi:hypothetical protein